MSLKRLIGLNIKLKTAKLQDENIEEIHCDCGLGKYFSKQKKTGNMGKIHSH